MRNSLVAVRYVDQRAALLPTDKILEEGALDKYAYVRDAYLQHRRNAVYDGNPPRLIDPEDDADDSPPQRSPGNAGPAKRIL
mgnify:CR=1 FL=1